MPDLIETDLAVLGAGPGGYAAAFLAADKGMKVALVDAGSRPGGVCLHCGCIPSKAFLHAARLITEAREAEAFGIKFQPPDIDVAKLRARNEQIVNTLAGHLAKAAEQRKVTWIQSRGKFENSTTLVLENGTRVRFRHCIIATGSVPARLGDIPENNPAIWDSNRALQLEQVPKSLLVVGGGYIGLEMGTVYAALGSEVTVVELLGTILTGVDNDLVLPLRKRLDKLFRKIYTSTSLKKLTDTGKGLQASFEGAELADDEKEQVFERVLVAVGRKPNSANLGLENTRVQVDAKGYIQVDERRRTTDEHIFAIGDVAGEPMLAHKAAHEGKLAVQVIAGEPVTWDVRAIPAVVFTDPEIAWAGLTETEARKQKRNFEVTRFRWASSGRAATLARDEGLTKIIYDPQTDRVLGVGITGVGAGEMIAEGVLAIEMGATTRDLAMTIHPHPTLTETVGEAAEFVHGLASHLFKVRR